MRSDGPPCECHGVPQRWGKDARCNDGGYWRCRVKTNEAHKSWRDKSAENREKNRHDRKYREEFLAEYGCKCVGTADGEPCANNECRPDALTVAHMNNDGNVHRARVGTGSKVIRDLRRRGWPKDEGISVQCANCQLLDARRLVRAQAV